MFEQFEQYAVFLLILGALLVLIGALGLIASAFRQRIWWGLAGLLLPLGGALAYISVHFRKAVRPLLIMLLGALVLGGTYGTNYYLAHFVDLGPREKMVDGELHITLTGWDHTD